MRKLPATLPNEDRTVYKMLRASVDTFGNAPALHQPIGDGEFQTYTWHEYQRQVEQVAAGLRLLGLKRGDIVGLASETRAEFYIADIGVMASGMTAAAVYTSLAPSDQARTLKACDPKAVFFESAKMMAALDVAGASTLDVPRILLTGSGEGAITLAELRRMGEAALTADPHYLDRMVDEVEPADHCILYLTSGATGEPKMGLVTHASVVSNCDMGPSVLFDECMESSLAFLPSAHITQRLVMELLMVRMGVTVWFSEGLSKMPVELRTVKPTFFIAPPRVWERVYASILTEIKKKPAVVRRLFYMGLGAGLEVHRAKVEGRQPSAIARSSIRLFDKVIFSKIRERLGGRMKLAVSGAAPLGRDLAEFYSAVGLPLVEGYGLTEGGVVALNPISDPLPGSIGKPLPGVEFKLAEDGELLIRSQTLFEGYYKDPEASAAVLQQGWLHTGDVAQIDDRGYVHITGRKKELIVSSNGKKIYPARIETLFKTEPLVNQILLVGDRLPYMAALVTLNLQLAETVPGLPASTPRTPAALAASPAVEAEVKRIIQRVNKQLAPFEVIRRFKILDRDFSLEAGELTPTMKLRRTKVLENFRSEVLELYAGREEMA